VEQNDNTARQPQKRGPEVLLVQLPAVMNDMPDAACHYGDWMADLPGPGFPGLYTEPNRVERRADIV
jgi:hypothetical protein